MRIILSAAVFLETLLLYRFIHFLRESGRIDLSARLEGRETDCITGMVEPDSGMDRINSSLSKLGPVPVFVGITVFFAAFAAFFFLLLRFL